MLQLSDPKLLYLFRVGEKEAFKLIFDTYYCQLVRYCINRGATKEIAEETAILGFEKLYKNKNKYQSIDHIKRSLFIMVKNAFIDILRSNEREKKYIDYKAEINTQDYLESDNETIEELKHSLLIQYINSLPKWRFIIIRSLYFDNMTTDEIATKYNLSIQTVRNTKTCAINWLKEKLIQHKYLYETT